MRNILFPFSMSYRIGVAARNFLFDKKIFTANDCGLPVIAVGNITTGGTGKTPCVKFIVEWLLQSGKHPAVISRGYGRRSSGMIIVADGNKILASVEDAGDEAMLIATNFPGVIVAVAERRIDAALAARKLGADCIVADDAFQHRALHRTLNIVMAGDELARGNNPLLPAGDGREPLPALRRAEVVIATSRDEERVKNNLKENSAAKLFFADVEAVDLFDPKSKNILPLAWLRDRAVMIATGIAHPERVASSAASLGAKIIATRAFPDHHWFTEKDLRELAELTKKNNATLLTTEKDWIRFGAVPVSSVVFGNVDVCILRVRLTFRRDRDAFEKIISAQLL